LKEKLKIFGADVEGLRTGEREKAAEIARLGARAEQSRGENLLSL